MLERHRKAVIILETEKSHRGYVPCIVEEGVSGYFITTWNFGDDLGLARGLADAYNEKLGLTKREVCELTLKSMRVTGEPT